MTKEAPPHRGLVREHLGLVLTLVPFLVVLVGLLSLSRGDPETLAILLQTANSKALVLGTVAAALPVVLSTALLAEWVERGKRTRRGLGNENRWWFAPLLALTFFELLVYSPWTTGIYVTAGFGIAWAISALGRTDRTSKASTTESQKPSRFSSSDLLPLVPAIWLISFAASPGWLASEAISIEGQRVERVYVLETSGDQLTVLRPLTTRVQYVNAAAIERRYVCSNARPSLADLTRKWSGDAEASDRNAKCPPIR